MSIRLLIRCPYEKKWKKWALFSFEIISHVLMNRGDQSKSTMIPGIVDIQAVIKDTFMAAKFWKNVPYKVAIWWMFQVLF